MYFNPICNLTTGAMGIPGFVSFIMKHFSRWQPPSGGGKSRVIVDGSNVCFSLYRENHTWCLGGEYKQFSHTIEEFVCQLRADFDNPIVILDGARCDQTKMETRRQRRIQSMRVIDKMQRRGEWDPKRKEIKGSAPLMIIHVFLAVLKSMNVEFYFADGEGDREIAALANHHKCPVLASDSDFFIYNLTFGFIHFERYRNIETRNESRYFVTEFQRQFSLQEHDLCLLVPLIAGNDFIRCQYASHQFRFLESLAKYKSCEDYITSSDNTWPSCTLENHREIKKQYCDMTLPESYLGGSFKHPAFDKLPKWVSVKVKEGCFPTHLVQAYHNRVSLLPQVVEVIREKSAWLASKDIRQHLYGIMGLSEYKTEVIRKDSRPDLIETVIFPRKTTPPVSIAEIETMENEKRQDLVLTVLKCQKDAKFLTLSEELKLPIAATFYWYQKLTCPASMAKRSYLVKSLLLGFLACSDEIQTSIQPLEPVTPATKSAHLTALHAFAEWQCVYSDAMALNRLAREPFLTTSPARLYSGEVTMYYAFVSERKENWLDDFIFKYSEEWALFNKLLYLVTGRDEEGIKRRKTCS